MEADDDQSMDLPSIEYAPGSRLKMRWSHEGGPVARGERLGKRFCDGVLGDEDGDVLRPDECR
jgi:hypothetical protein